MAERSSHRCLAPVLRGAAVGICLGLGGCVALDPDFDATALRKPQMPTIAPAPPEPPPKVVNPADALAAASRFAEQGEFPAAVRSLEMIGDLASRVRVFLDLTANLAGTKPELAVRLATAWPAGVARADAIAVAARGLTRSDPAEALRWSAAQSDPAIAAVARRAVVRELIRGDARAAIGRIEALPAGEAREDTLVFAVAEWARVDTDGAIRWVDGLPDDALRQRLTSGIGFEIAQENPVRAVGLAETLPPGRNRWLLFGAIAQTWVATDPKAALAWSRRLPAGESREAAFAGVETGLGVPVARRRINAPTIRNSTPRGLGGAANRDDTHSAEFAAWRALQAPGLSRDEAILEYVRQRGSFDSGAMGQWLAALPGGPTRDQALELYLEGRLQSSPAAAANWLRSLPRSDRSDEMIEKAARQWLLRDPEAAAAWLLETPLPPDRKEWLLRQAGR